MKLFEKKFQKKRHKYFVLSILNNTFVLKK